MYCALWHTLEHIDPIHKGLKNIVSNIVMKSNNQTINLVDLIAVLQDMVQTTDVPKTSARLKSNEPVAEIRVKKASKASKQVIEDDDDDDIITINVPSGRDDIRVKIPRMAFNAKGICFVDGDRYTALESDNGRSSKIDPATFGAEEGDVITLIRESGNKWASEVASSGRKAKKSAKPAPAKSSGSKLQKAGSKKASPKAEPKAKSERITSFEGFAEKCLKNAGKGFSNKNIMEADVFGAFGTKDKVTLDADARQYLTSDENRKFKAFRLSKGLNLRAAVKNLNALVFED